MSRFISKGLYHKKWELHTWYSCNLSYSLTGTCKLGRLTQVTCSKYKSTTPTLRPFAVFSVAQETIVSRTCMEL